MSLRAVVLRGTGGVWHVRDEDGREHVVSLRGRLKTEGGEKLAVGDEVELARSPGHEALVITAVEPRRSRLARRAPGGARGERLIAANVDQVVVVFAAVHPAPRPSMLDRFLVIAAANELPARIVINKVDLVDAAAVGAGLAAYEAAGYPLHLTSTRTGAGLDALRNALTGRNSVLSGPSGVGKSSLVNAIFPGLQLRVGAVSASLDQGRHTTVGAEMHPVPGGGYVTDTPGLREVGLWGIPPVGLERCFPEMRPLLGACRFRDCSHRAEPDCAVRDGIAAGTVSPERYDSYLRLLAEAKQG